MGPTPLPVADRLLSKTVASETDFYNGTACLLWTGTVDRRWGYGRLTVAGKDKRAHRLAYEIAYGPIAPGLVLDHLCRRPRCVNPLHLEPVSNKTNILRGISFSASNAVKTHCPRGHEYTVDNLAKTGYGRRCLTCKREYGRAYMRTWRAK